MTERAAVPGRIRRFVDLDWHRRLVLSEAVVLVAIASIAARLLPFRWLRPLYGRARSGPDAGQAPPSGAPERPDPMLRDVRWALAAVERVQRPHRGCLGRAIAGRLMLLRRGYRPVLHIGARRGEGGAADLHAWLTEGGTPVTGVRGARRFTPLVTFDAE